MNDKYYQKSIQKIENEINNINHLEKVFTEKNYYQAMKQVPLLERKVLYLYYVEKYTTKEICQKLKLNKIQVIALKNKGIKHFKRNIKLLYSSKNGKNTNG